VAWAQIGSLTDYLEAKLLFGNEAVSFLGYPSSASGGEGGFVVSCRDTISVSSRTAVPEEAWEFVKFMLSREALRAAGLTNSGIPLLKSVSRDVAEGLMGEWSYDAESNWLDGRGMGGIPVSVDEACVEEYLAFIGNARVDPAVPGQVDAILGEELSAFFAGARSAEETGRMIQNRIGNYLNERK
jgi:multiple sugar transport system substrate-binding protein